MESTKRNFTAPFVAFATFLVGGGAEQLKTRLSRQWLQWGGVAIIAISLVGYWGITPDFVLSNEQFVAGLGAAVALMGVNHLDTKAALEPKG